MEYNYDYYYELFEHMIENTAKDQQNIVTDILFITESQMIMINEIRSKKLNNAPVIHENVSKQLEELVNAYQNIQNKYFDANGHEISDVRDIYDKVVQ